MFRRLCVTPLFVAILGRSLAAQGIPVAKEFDALHFRSIGPAIMSGRIADIAAYESNPAVFYVGTSHGGVWKTTSNGATWIPLLQDQGLMSIGAVAISQTNPDLVWVGTGESNNRQSTSWGDGVYKSTDGGKTFVNMGLKESKHIGRIVIDPRNNDVVFVAAAGPLFGPGGDRGIYKTTDGGKTWKSMIKVDENTGANDIAMSHENPSILVASTYQRRRTACCVNGGDCRQRHLEIDRRRRELDPPFRWPPRRSDGAHRRRHLPPQLEPDLCIGRRSRGGWRPRHRRTR